MATGEKLLGDDAELRTGPRRNAVREAIRALVIDGELRPGDRLVERHLADRLGVSRVPVREALQQLEREGFAEERPTRGMVVSRLSEDDIDALFQVRDALEGVVCQRAVAADEAALARLDVVVRRTADALSRGDVRTAVESNAAFHEALVDLAGTVLASVMEPVAGRMRWLLSQHEDPAAMNADHDAIAHALRERDVRTARRLCRGHLEASRAAVRAAAGG